MARTRSLGMIAALCALVASPLHAQELRGTITASDGATPASGAIVVLLHATRDSTLARAVTGARGAYSVRAPVATLVRMRVLRVGFQPMLVGSYTLAAGESRTVDVSLSDAPIVLSSFKVQEASRCDVRPDSAGIVAQLFEEARKALIVSATQATGVRSTATFTLFTRVENLRGRAVLPTQRTTVTGPTNRPFASLSVDSLAKVGYVVEERDGTVYRAPDADVLLSDVFAAGHCVSFVNGTGERSASVGIGFRPVASRKGIIDIRGTLWLDRATSELQQIEYTYDGIPREHQRGGVGGRVEFARTADGGWLVNRWAIRMPRIAMRQQEGTQRIGGGAGFTPIEAIVDTIVVTGGEVQSVRVDGELQYASAATISADDGPMPSNASGAAANVAARSALTVDTVVAVSTCEDVRNNANRGVVQGRVLDGARAGQSGVAVVAEWKQDFRHVGGDEWRWEYRRLNTTSGANGQYVLCGAPLDRPVTVVAGAAANDTRRTRGLVVRMSPREPRTSVDLSVGTPAIAGKRSSLLRVVDASGAPIAHALVRVDGALSRVGDAEGRAVLPVVSSDSVRVSVRRIGFTPFEGTAGRASANEPFQVTLLPAAQALAAVNVRARGERSPLDRTGFYERLVEVQRSAMLGDFITPEELEIRGSAKASQLLSGNRYARVLHIAPGRGMATKPVLVGRGGCPMTVFIDGVQAVNLYDGTHGSDVMAPAIDDLVNPGAITAIEIYPTVFGAPAKLIPSSSSPSCGIVAIWTGAR